MNRYLYPTFKRPPIRPLQIGDRVTINAAAHTRTRRTLLIHPTAWIGTLVSIDSRQGGPEVAWDNLENRKLLRFGFQIDDLERLL